MKRRLLGAANSIAARQRVYEFDQGLEVDDIDHFEVTRKRVFYDDVVAVTHHRHIGWPLVTASLVMVLLFASVAVAVRETTAVAVTFILFALLFLLPALFRVLLRVDVITVTGRRSRAVMRFTFRKKRARAIFEEVSARAAAAQQRVVEENRASRVTDAVIE